MADTTSTWDKVVSLIGAGTSVYSQVSGHPIISPIGDPTAQYESLQAQINLTAQQNLNRQAPVTAGILANPTVLIILALAAVLLLVFLFRR